MAGWDDVARICLALPETSERLSHGSPTFFIREKKTFVMYLDDHHGDGILGIWCAAPDGVQAALVEAEPERFFRPPYVGHRGWLGVRLDRDAAHATEGLAVERDDLNVKGLVAWHTHREIAEGHPGCNQHIVKTEQHARGRCWSGKQSNEWAGPRQRSAS